MPLKQWVPSSSVLYKGNITSTTENYRNKIYYSIHETKLKSRYANHQKSFKNSRPYHFKFFKRCLRQISLGPFFDTLSQIQLGESNKVYLMCTNERSTFLNIIGSLDRNILTRDDSQVTETLFYGDSNLNNITNTLILNATIDFVIASERFDISLF